MFKESFVYLSDALVYLCGKYYLVNHKGTQRKTQSNAKDNTTFDF
jgi:hypothetical protein